MRKIGAAIAITFAFALAMASPAGSAGNVASDPPSVPAIVCC